MAFNRALLPKPLSALPGGGLAHNSILEVEDQEQRFNAQLVITHRVSERADPPRLSALRPIDRGRDVSTQSRPVRLVTVFSGNNSSQILLR